MTRRIPLVSTVVVLLAAATMIALGFWQLDRLEQKEALIARYLAAADNEQTVRFPADGDDTSLLFRRSSVDCTQVRSIQPTAGRNARGESGWAQRATCFDGRADAEVIVDIGWTRSPQPVAWDGGLVSGTIAPGPRLVAANAAAAETRPLAQPDPSDLPNNHLAYAGQWFFFALTALVIYGLALRRRWQTSGS